MKVRPSASVHVCALRHIPEVMTRTGASHLISAINAELAPATPAGLSVDRHLKLDMHDIIEMQPGATAPAEEHVGQLIDFVQSWDRQAPLLIHCYAGSTARPPPRSSHCARSTRRRRRKPSRVPCVRPPTRQCRTGASSASPMRSSSARAACWRRSIAWGRTVSQSNASPSASRVTTPRTSTARREPAASAANRHSGHGSGPRRPAFVFVGPRPQRARLRAASRPFHQVR